MALVVYWADTQDKREVLAYMHPLLGNDVRTIILAATSIANNVADVMDVTLGKKVGYITGKDKDAEEGTKVLFMTEGSASPAGPRPTYRNIRM